MGLYHVELRKPKDSPGKNKLTPVKTQNLPDIEKAESKDENSCLKWSIDNGRRKIRINFQTDTDKVNVVAYRYRNNTYLKDTELELKLIEYENLIAERVYLLSYIDIYLSATLYWMKQLFTTDLIPVANGRSPSCKLFPILIESNINF